MGTDMRYLPLFIAAVLTGLVSLPARADFHVFACEPEWTALARTFIPDAHFTTATSYLQDPHYIEARPSLIAAMSRADIAVCTGASLEAGWLPALLQRAGNPDIQTGQPGLFFASDHAQLFAPHDHVDRSMGDAAAILIASHQNQKPAQWLSAQTRKPILVLPGTVTDDSKTDTLAELISEIINRLESAMPEVADGSL